MSRNWTVIAAACIAMVVWWAGPAPADQPPVAATQPTTASADVEPKLVADPKVIKIIEQLGEGESAVLPPAKTAGDLNDEARKWGLDKTGPGGRDYCVKMLWMPDRKRAAYCGANHAYPHRLNDVWEYDLASNTWVCLYGPDKSKGGKEADWDDVAVDANGIFRTKRGGPAVVGHQWWQISYDPERRAIVWMCAWGSDAPFAKALPAKMNGRLPNPPLWLFYPCQRTWEPAAASKFVGQRPKGANASAMEYVPDLGRSLWMKQDGTWSYDSKSDTWTDMQPNEGQLKHGDPRSHAWEGVTVYVPSRKMLVSAGGNRPTPERKEWIGRTNVYNVRANTWKKVADGDGVPAGSDAWSPFVYDSVADICLLCDREGRFWALDIDQAKWSNFTPKGPPLPGRIRPMSYYDPQHNVWVIERGGQVWIYRHKNVKK